MDESVQKYLKPTLDKSGNLLLKAANLIEERGWCQNDMRTRDGRLCIIGALHAATGSDYWDGPGGFKWTAYQRLYAHFSGEPAQWNDVVAKSQSQVVAKLRAVALGG